jgi:hypothetical protein
MFSWLPFDFKKQTEILHHRTSQEYCCSSSILLEINFAITFFLSKVLNFHDSKVSKCYFHEPFLIENFLNLWLFILFQVWFAIYCDFLLFNYSLQMIAFEQYTVFDK